MKAWNGVTSPNPLQRIPWVSLYTTAVIVAGLVVVLIALSTLPVDRFGLLLFAVTAAIAELTNVELFTNSRSRVSVSSVIAIAAMLALGPFAGALAHLFSGAATLITTALKPPPELNGRVSWVQRTAFNAGMWVLAAAAAGQVYVLLGGTPGVVSSLTNVVPLIVAVTVDVMVNLLLLIGVITLQTRQSPWLIWTQNFQWSAPIAIAGSVIGGGMLALAYQMFGVLGVAVFLLPVLATAYSFQIYMRHSKGYVEQIERALTDLRQSDERYALATQGANDGLWDWNLETHQIFYSPRWKAMLGYGEDELTNNPEEWFNRVHREDREALETSLKAHMDGMSDHFENEHRIRHKNDEYLWVLTRGVAVRGDQGAYRMAGSQSDITARKMVEAQLQHDALHDMLTGLYNRNHFINQVGESLYRLKHHNGDPFAVLFLDFDRFKNINDSLGHALGDQLLIAVARRLESLLLPGDMVARLGGDEFTILMKRVKTSEVATYFAERIQAQLKFAFDVSGHKVLITTSIGIAMSQSHYENAEEVLRDADIAMYRAKDLGKMRYALFTPAMRTHTLVRLAMETDLQRALERQELLLHYQPILSMESGGIIGFEALVRWRHAEQGIIQPLDFIPIAEESGLITAVDHWVMTEACKQLRHWQTRFPTAADLFVSVNLSSRHFTHRYLTDSVAEILQTTGINPRCLQLEVTEGSIIENTERVNPTLAELRELGVRLSIDDFGTGYSSLSYLRAFTFDNLKLDRSFVHELGTTGENSEIIRTIITLAHELGMTVTAEGVENPTHVEPLKMMGCEYAQGFYFAHPDNAGVAERLIVQLGVGVAHA